MISEACCALQRRKVPTVVLAAHQGNARGLAQGIGVSVVTAQALMDQTINARRAEYLFRELPGPFTDAIGPVGGHTVVT